MDIRTFTWVVAKSLAENFAALGGELAQCGDLFRIGELGPLAVIQSDGSTAQVIDSTHLAAVIADRLDARTDDGGKIPKGDLATALRAESFMSSFQVVDLITSRATYLEDFRLAAPGYNEGEPGWRIFYAGPDVEVADGLEATAQFLDAMTWRAEADRTNAVAMRLVTVLRNHWPGAKPAGTILGNKSHAGKDTVADYIRGTVPDNEISWQKTDWALEEAFEKATRAPEVRVVRVGNVRSDGEFIRSAFLERFLTNPQPMLTCTKTRAGRVVGNSYVVLFTTNDGVLSPDLLNRSIVIRMEAVGDVRTRTSPIGNPREEFLPAHQDQIDAETHGMIARWREAGCPLDESVRHPMSSCTRVIGGILKVNGFAGFLANHAEALAVQEPVREALGILGAMRPGDWLRIGQWVTLMREAGLVHLLMPSNDRENDTAMARRLGMIMSKHQDETTSATTDAAEFEFRIGRWHHRWGDAPNAYPRYRFEVLSERSIPADDESSEPEEDAGAASPSTNHVADPVAK